MKREVKIGIFLAGTLLILGLFVFVAGDMSTWFQKPGYELSALFPSATGLEKRAAVRLAGVKIGYVKDIRLDERKARVIITVWPKYQVPRRSQASLASLGLVGERYIEIKPSDAPDYMKPGETLEVGVALGFDELGDLAASIGDELKAVTGSLREITNEESKKNLSTTLKNLSAFSQELSEFMAANKAELQSGIQSASRAARDFDQKMGVVSQDLAQTIQAVKAIAVENEDAIKSNIQKLDEVLTELQESIRLLRNSLEKIDKGEGTVGKLVQSPELYDEARETLQKVKGTVEPLQQVRAAGNFQADYLGKTEKYRGALTGSFYLTPRTFLFGQVVDDSRNEGFVYTAQAGMRFGAVAPRAGIFESEFGAGVDILALNDRLMFSLDGFNFERAGGPRFRLSGQFALLRYLHLILGVDDFSSDSRREIYFGLGLGTR